MFNSRQMATGVTVEELQSIQAKRAEAIRKAGTKWLLHPSNYVQRKTPKPRAALMMLAMVMLAGVGNDCDGRCPAPTQEVAP